MVRFLRIVLHRLDCSAEIKGPLAVTAQAEWRGLANGLFPGPCPHPAREEPPNEERMSANVAKFAIVGVWPLLSGPWIASPHPPVVRSTKLGTLPAAMRSPSACPLMAVPSRNCELVHTDATVVISLTTTLARDASPKVVSVHEHQGKFSAEANPYGSRGTEFDTPEKTIRSLLGDNGCTNIRIEYGPNPER
jgi:hypothetical protein